jgi:hypothetical protein
VETLERLCHQFVEIKSSPNPDRSRLVLLEREIRNADTTLRFNENALAVVAGIIALYYRAGLDSVGVGAELGFLPTHIRQTLLESTSRGGRAFYSGRKANPEAGAETSVGTEEGAHLSLRSASSTA